VRQREEKTIIDLEHVTNDVRQGSAPEERLYGHLSDQQHKRRIDERKFAFEKRPAQGDFSP
jgi:hypothetical protein